jgi:hypothetical protein
MDYEHKSRNKKSDKAKRNFDLTGGMSQAHVRRSEALAEARLFGNSGAPKSEPEKVKGKDKGKGKR